MVRSLDVSLALQTLPANRGRAESLGVWSVAGTIGSYGGPFVGSVVLSLGSRGEKEYYDESGQPHTKIYSWERYLTVQLRRRLFSSGFLTIKLIFLRNVLCLVVLASPGNKSFIFPH